MGSTNPVAGSYFNFTVCEPTDVVGIVAIRDFVEFKTTWHPVGS